MSIDHKVRDLLIAWAADPLHPGLGDLIRERLCKHISLPEPTAPAVPSGIIMETADGSVIEFAPEAGPVGGSALPEGWHLAEQVHGGDVQRYWREDWLAAAVGGDGRGIVVALLRDGSLFAWSFGPRFMLRWKTGVPAVLGRWAAACWDAQRESGGSE